LSEHNPYAPPKAEVRDAPAAAVAHRLLAEGSDQVPTLATLVGKRYCVMWLVSLLPSVGVVVNLVDDLPIFRSDRRCLHDLIAGTKVIMAGPSRAGEEPRGAPGR
jgi:hypothetical protein